MGFNRRDAEIALRGQRISELCESTAFSIYPIFEFHLLESFHLFETNKTLRPSRLLSALRG